MGDRLTYFGWGATAVVALAAGVGVGYAIWGTHADQEAPRPAVRQPDASLVLARAAPAAAPAAPAHQIPRGSREERRIAVTVKPKDCRDLQLDLSLIRAADGLRVVASSPDGTVTGGADQPIAQQLDLGIPHPWAAGITFGGRQAWGTFVHRDIWRLRLGLEVSAREGGGSEARAVIGWTW